MRIGNKGIIALCTLATISAAAWGGDISDIGASVRSIGMGGAYVTVPNTSNGIFGNPALLGMLKRSEFISQYGDFGGDVKYSVLGFGSSNNVLNYGVGLYAVDLGQFNKTSIEPDTGQILLLDSFNFNTNTMVAGAGGYITDRLLFGMRGKYLKQSGYGSINAVSVSVDLGVAYDITENIKVGMVGTNILPSIGDLKFDNGSTEAVYGKIDMGIGLEMENKRVYADVSFVKDSQIEVKVGGEMSFSNLAIRGGLQKRSGENNNYTLGVGYKYNLLSVDYAYICNTLISGASTHFVSFGIEIPEMSLKGISKEKTKEKMTEKAIEKATEQPNTKALPKVKAIEVKDMEKPEANMHEGETALEALFRKGRINKVKTYIEDLKEKLVSATKAKQTKKMIELKKQIKSEQTKLKSLIG